MSHYARVPETPHPAPRVGIKCVMLSDSPIHGGDLTNYEDFLISPEFHKQLSEPKPAAAMPAVKGIIEPVRMDTQHEGAGTASLIGTKRKSSHGAAASVMASAPEPAEKKQKSPNGQVVRKKSKLRPPGRLRPPSVITPVSQAPEIMAVESLSQKSPEASAKFKDLRGELLARWGSHPANTPRTAKSRPVEPQTATPSSSRKRRADPSPRARQRSLDDTTPRTKKLRVNHPMSKTMRTPSSARRRNTRTPGSTKRSVPSFAKPAPREPASSNSGVAENDHSLSTKLRPALSDDWWHLDLEGEPATPSKTSDKSRNDSFDSTASSAASLSLSSTVGSQGSLGGTTGSFSSTASSQPGLAQRLQAIRASMCQEGKDGESSNSSAGEEPEGVPEVSNYQARLESIRARTKAAINQQESRLEQQTVQPPAKPVVGGDTTEGEVAQEDRDSAESEGAPRGVKTTVGSQENEGTTQSTVNDAARIDTKPQETMPKSTNSDTDAESPKEGKVVLATVSSNVIKSLSIGKRLTPKKGVLKRTPVSGLKARRNIPTALSVKSRKPIVKSSPKLNVKLDNMVEQLDDEVDVDSRSAFLRQMQRALQTGNASAGLRTGVMTSPEKEELLNSPLHTPSKWSPIKKQRKQVLEQHTTCTKYTAGL